MWQIVCRQLLRPALKWEVSLAEVLWCLNGPKWPKEVIQNTTVYIRRLTISHTYAHAYTHTYTRAHTLRRQPQTIMTTTTREQRHQQPLRYIPSFIFNSESLRWNQPSVTVGALHTGWSKDIEWRPVWINHNNRHSGTSINSIRSVWINNNNKPVLPYALCSAPETVWLQLRGTVWGKQSRDHPPSTM